MVKATPQNETPVDVGPAEDMYFFAMPAATYRSLSNIATESGMTTAQVLKSALDEYLGKLGEKKRLLLESASAGKCK